MNAIWQKIKADLFHRRVVSILIICTIAVAATLLTLALSTLMNLGGPYDRIFEEVNGAHLWLFFKPGRAATTDIHQIESLPGVAGSTGWQYSYDTQARIHDARVWVTLRVVPLEQPTIHRYYLLDGRAILPNAREIMAEKFFVDTYKMRVGDTITITRSDGRDVNLPVIGSAYDVMYDTYRSDQSPYLYVSESTLISLFPDKAAWGRSLGLRLSDPEKVNEVLAEVEAMRSLKFIESHTDWQDVKESAIFEGQLASVFLIAFSLFAILATVLIILSVVSSTILSQIKQIGILKALGFTGGQILLLYTGQYTVLSLIGTALGFALGLALAPVPMQAITASLNTTYLPSFSFLLVLLVFCIIPGVTILAALGASSRGARANIIKSIAVGAEAPLKKMFWGARLAETLGAPIVLVLGLNDIFVRPLRSVFTGLNLMLGVTGIVLGLALLDTVDSFRNNPALVGIPYDAIVTRQQVSDSLARRLLEKAPGVEAFYGEIQTKAWTLDEKAFTLRAVEGGLDSFPFHIPEGRFFQPGSNEAIAGKGLLDWLGLRIGDTLTIRLEEKDGSAVTVVIVGTYPEPSDAGQRLMLNLSSISRLVKRNDPNAYYLKLSPGADVDAIRSYLSPRRESDLNLVVIKEVVPDSIIYLQVAIFALSGILIIIAIVNVFIMSLLTAQEKLRVIGVLKTIGMTPAQVVRMFNITAGSLGMLAVLFGVPFGLVITKNLFIAVTNSLGFGQISVSINLTQTLLLIPFIVIFSVMGSYIPARWAAQLYIVKILRNE